MPAYRPLGQFPQYFLADGTVNAGGLINFYETDLTTRQDTFSDEGLTTPNSNPVVLDSSGRPTTDVWGSLAYGVVITDSLGANPRTANDVQPDSGAGSGIPSLVNGEFLTNNGSVLEWSSIIQVPDPTGEPSGNTLQTDGTLVFWAAPPAPTPVSGDSTGIIVGTTRIQYGTGSFPASGTNNTQLNISFPTPFSATPYFVGVTPNNQTPTAIEGVLIPSACNLTASGFLAYADTNFTASSNSHTIISVIAFQWVAFGPL
jgi:hypothetical protein